MKFKTINLILILIIFICPLYTDVGNCVRYEVELKLKNDSSVSGFFYYLSYNPKFNFTDEEFLDFFNSLRETGRRIVLIYTKIEKLNYPRFPGLTHNNCEFYLTAAIPENTRRINLRDIKSARLSTCNTCNPCDLDDKKRGYFWNGINPTVITELSKEETKLHKNLPVSSFEFGLPWDEFCRFYVLSYNKKINRENLEKICRKEISKFPEQDYTSKYYERFQDHYRKMKQKLREKNITIFKLCYAN